MGDSGFFFLFFPPGPSYLFPPSSPLSLSSCALPGIICLLLFSPLQCLCFCFVFFYAFLLSFLSCLYLSTSLKFLLVCLFFACLFVCFFLQQQVGVSPLQCPQTESLKFIKLDWGLQTDHEPSLAQNLFCLASTVFTISKIQMSLDESFILQFARVANILYCIFPLS